VRQIDGGGRHLGRHEAARDTSATEGGDGACDVCGGPASLRCARCRGVWYCGPKCQRAACGAHKSACAAAVAAVRGGGGGGESAGKAGADGVVGSPASGAAVAAPREPDAGGGSGGTGGLSAATLREIARAVALLGSRKAKERVAGSRDLARIAKDGYNNNRKLVEFQEAVVAAGGVPLIVRALGAAETAEYAAYVVLILSAYSSDCCVAIAAAGGIPPLIVLLASPSVHVQTDALNALCNLSASDENEVAIASAGGLSSRSSRRRRPTCRRLLCAHLPT
jgi:hypothetical protein